MVGLAEVDLAHPRVGGDRRGRVLGEHRAADQHRDPLGEAEHQVHVVLDQQDRHLARQRGDGLEQRAALAGGNAGGRLVEQQHARSRVVWCATSSRRSRSSSCAASSTTSAYAPTGRQNRAPTPRCSHTASATDSSTVISANSRLIWKVRASPRLTRWCWLQRVTSSPSRITVPAVGTRKPLSRLISVVLPAPLGPISAWRAPAAMASETSWVATKPPNFFFSARV